MDIKKFDIVKHYLSLVQECLEYRRILYTMERSLINNSAVQRSEANSRSYKAFEDIVSLTYEKELDAWRTIGLLTLAATSEQRKEIRALAYKRFYDTKKAVMYLVDDLGHDPNSWLSNDEKELRKWLTENFKGDDNDKG